MRSLRTGLALALCVLASARLGAAETPPDAALRAAVANPARTPRLAARDAARHPAEELAFLGLRPDAQVIEIWPGRGYWTEILAPYLAAHGQLTVALPPADDPDEGAGARAMLARMARDRATFGRVRVAILGGKRIDLGPDGSVDLVLTFRNLHNWMADGSAPAVLAGFYRVLKPGGVLGIEDHRGRTDRPQDPKARDGYVRQDAAVALVEAAGFRLAGSSEIDANPRDTKDWPQGVWTLPPTFALGRVDRARYAAVGEADNFVLKFVKPGR